MIADIQYLQLTGNFQYAFRLEDGFASAAPGLVIDASHVGGHRDIYIDASAETENGYTMIAAGGDNTLLGGAGNDTFEFSRFDAGDFVDGGGGFDTLFLLNSVHHFAIAPGNALNIENFAFSGVSDASVTGSLAQIHIDGSHGDQLRLDVSNASIGQLNFLGGSGDDTVVFGTDFSASDQINGGSGIDTMTFGAASMTLDLGSHIQGMDKVVLLGAASTYQVTVGFAFDFAVTAFVDATALTDPASSLDLDASQATDSVFDVAGGAGDDTITGGIGPDMLTGGTGSDTFVYQSSRASDMQGFSWDRITDFDPTQDFIKLAFAATYDGETSGTVYSPSQNLGALVNPLLTVDGAVLVDVKGGRYEGHILLVIDADHNGTFSNADMLIDLKGMTNEASFGSGDFIT